MSNVIEFKPRAKAAPEAQARPAASGGSAHQDREPAGQAEAPAGVSILHGTDALDKMEQEGAAMQVLAALMFYAGQGIDHGARARRAVSAMQELLSGAPVRA